MFEIFVVLAVFGSLCMAVLLFGFVFKLLFMLIGGVFSVVGGLLALLVGAALMLALLPLFAVIVLPLCVPLLFVIGMVWLIVHLAKRPSPAWGTAAPR